MARAGELRHVLTLEKNTPVRDATGGETPSWAAVGTVRAKVEGLSGSELLAARQVTASSSVRVEIYHWPGLNSVDYRFVEGTRVLNIDSCVDPDGKGRWMVCACTERVA